MNINRFLIGLTLVATIGSTALADKLVILHTNDSHSQIDPADNGQGGVLRRKALIDSVRACNANVLLLDLGDAVQGTMYYTIYKGEVEYGLLDLLGYDAAILGNHDFDNGAEALADNLGGSNTTWITTNYDLSGAPGLDSIFVPYVLKRYGDKTVGLLAVNLVPEGMIAKGNYNGVVYRDGYEAANAMAWLLKNRLGADYVVALTHIGYDGLVDPSDVKLAARSRNIDLIIGGHSHSVIDPDNETERFYWKHLNADADTVAVVQAGSRGAFVGQVVLDLDNGHLDYSLLPVDSRYDSATDPALKAILDGYRASVDSIMAIPVATAARHLGKDDSSIMNFLGDFTAAMGERLSGAPVDLSIMNGGGVRRELPQGTLTKGMIIDMLPFNNRVVVLEISGADLLEALDVVAKRGGSDGICDGCDIVIDRQAGKTVKAVLKGRELKPDETYRLATIDYLANGGDYMSSLPRATEVARSRNVLYDDLLDYLATDFHSKPVDAPSGRRIVSNQQ